MDKAGWLNCKAPWPMLKFLQERLSQRKARLFVCACCRWAWHRLRNEHTRQAVILAERYADGEEDWHLLRDFQGGVDTDDEDTREAVQIALYVGAMDLSLERYWDSRQTSKKEEAQYVVQAALVRDIFGNPFRPLPTRSFPAHVQALAQCCYAVFPEVGPDYAILADALEELSEDQAAAHCRETMHVKGCHVLDWILKRQ